MLQLSKSLPSDSFLRILKYTAFIPKTAQPFVHRVCLFKYIGCGFGREALNNKLIFGVLCALFNFHAYHWPLLASQLVAEILISLSKIQTKTIHLVNWLLLL